MSRKRQRQWVTGTVFILAAIGILGVNVGWITFHVGILTIIMSIILAIIFGMFLLNFNVFGSVFSLAFLVMLYAGPLGITHMVPWSILGIALFLSIGLSILFRPLIHRQRIRRWNRWAEEKTADFINGAGRFSETTQETTGIENDQSHFNIEINVGESTKYIESENFQRADITASFSSLNVYFDKAKITDDYAVINVDGSTSEVTLYLPKEWNVINHVATNFGETDTKQSDFTDGPTVYINGSMSFGQLKIVYI
ncbi:hypothetical protein [Lentilactobacillus sp. Marseille-Q4993]|uniref:LiaF transmembrane domain-containing protein n=1 Tax=Lentilactobacillus sp. Marseille-Q4993 TaxID=3039492 RepID=UPI0024BCE4A1|nr:hypothetical protein [Lentilactobacillus sp. Marseille-Q4993]